MHARAVAEQVQVQVANTRDFRAIHDATDRTVTAAQGTIVTAQDTATHPRHTRRLPITVARETIPPGGHRTDSQRRHYPLKERR